MLVKLLAEHYLEILSLKGGYTGSSESTLVKMPHCWKSRAAAHLLSCLNYLDFFQLCGIWTTNHIANCSFIGWSTAFCFMSVAACANSSSKNYRYCVPEVDANIALAALCGTLGVLCLLFIIPSYYMYGCNYKAFNFKKGCCNLD